MKATSETDLLQEARKLLDKARISPVMGSYAAKGKYVAIFIDPIRHNADSKFDHFKQDSPPFLGCSNYCAVLCCARLMGHEDVALDWTKLTVFVVSDYAEAGSIPSFSQVRFDKYGRTFVPTLAATFTYHIELQRPYH